MRKLPTALIYELEKPALVSYTTAFCAAYRARYHSFVGAAT